MCKLKTLGCGLRTALGHKLRIFQAMEVGRWLSANMTQKDLTLESATDNPPSILEGCELGITTHTPKPQNRPHPGLMDQGFHFGLQMPSSDWQIPERTMTSWSFVSWKAEVPSSLTHSGKMEASLSCPGKLMFGVSWEIMILPQIFFLI